MHTIHITPDDLVELARTDPDAAHDVLVDRLIDGHIVADPAGPGFVLADPAANDPGHVTARLRIAIRHRRHRRHQQHIARIARETAAESRPSGDLAEPPDFALIARLTPAARAVIVARVIHDHDFARIGRDLGIAAATARKRFERAIRQLADHLDSEDR